MEAAAVNEAAEVLLLFNVDETEAADKAGDTDEEVGEDELRPLRAGTGAEAVEAAELGPLLLFLKSF